MYISVKTLLIDDTLYQVKILSFKKYFSSKMNFIRICFYLFFL